MMHSLRSARMGFLLVGSTLALGAELKNTVCLTKENRAFLSQHVGDMENLETYDFFLMTIDHLERILEIRPRVLARDFHPDYLSSGYAKRQTDLPVMEVQHHHAHIVSCLAEHGLAGAARLRPSCSRTPRSNPATAARARR